jgi:hypothetical protein
MELILCPDARCPILVCRGVEEGGIDVVLGYGNIGQQSFKR